MLRSRSALLSLEGLPDERVTAVGPPALRLEILTSLLGVGIERDTIEGIECMSKTRWYVVFIDQKNRNDNLNKEITIYETQQKLVHPNPPKPKQYRPSLIYVRVYGYPLDSDSDLLERAMRYYGPIAHTKEFVDRQCELKTGVRGIAYRSLTHAIPSYLYVGKHQVRCHYEGQIKTCRKCYQTGHLARDCPAGDVCRACGQADHTKANCPNRRCYRCEETGHVEAHCPQYTREFPDLGSQATDEHNGNDTDQNIDDPGSQPSGEQDPGKQTSQNPEDPINTKWGGSDWGTTLPKYSNNDTDNTSDDEHSNSNDMSIDKNANNLDNSIESKNSATTGTKTPTPPNPSETKTGNDTQEISDKKPTSKATSNIEISTEKQSSDNNNSNVKKPAEESREQLADDIKKNLFKYPPPPRERRERPKKNQRRVKSQSNDDSSGSERTPMNTDDEHEDQRGRKRGSNSPKKDQVKRTRIPISNAKNRSPYMSQTINN